jgi:hypothetical protein
MLLLFLNKKKFDNVIYAECHYAECHYSECHYAECRVIMLNVVILSVNMPNVVAPTDWTWAEFSTLQVSEYMLCIYVAAKRKCLT